MFVSDNRVWYFPYNPEGYDVSSAFSCQGFIYWHQGNKRYRVGDILYMYASLPEQRVTHKAEVVETDVIYNPSLDNDSSFVLKEGFGTQPGAKCIKIMPLEDYKGIRVNYWFLQNIGLENFRSPNTFTQEQIKKIESINMKPYDINFGRLEVGERVKTKAFGLGTVKEFEGDYVIIECDDRDHKFLYPSAVHKGFIVKE